MRRPLALRPCCCKKGCTAAGNSLILGGFVPAASAASYAHLMASLIMAVEAIFTCDRLGWISPLLASHHDGGCTLCRRANSRRASLDSELDSKMCLSIVRNSTYSCQPSMYMGWPPGPITRKPKRLPLPNSMGCSSTIGAGWEIMGGLEFNGYAISRVLKRQLFNHLSLSCLLHVDKVPPTSKPRGELYSLPEIHTFVDRCSASGRRIRQLEDAAQLRGAAARLARQ